MASRQYTAEEITTGLMAMIAWAGNASAAARYLKAEKGMTIPSATLYSWKQVHGEQYDDLRDKHQGQIEGHLANEFREVAVLATLAAREAVEATRERLAKGEETDTARAAANMATVAQKATDKLMTVTSRPTQIVENRDPIASMRRLVAMGVLQLPEGSSEDE